MENPKCPYCIRCDGIVDKLDYGAELETFEVKGGAVITYVKVTAYCHYCGMEVYSAEVNDMNKLSRDNAYAAAMKREKKCKTYAEDFKEHFGHSWNNKDNNWQCRGKLYNDSSECIDSPRCDCDACWNREMEANDE